MPAYIKFDGVDGESSDTFKFRAASDMRAPAADAEPQDVFVNVDPEPQAALLLPAVQAAREAAHEADPLPTEDFTMGYTEVEWTY